MDISASKELFERAKQYIPGGVNSPVRAFGAVGGSPVFMDRAEGAYLYDEDGNAYVDLINSWGAMILGHANKQVEEAIIKAVVGSPSFGTPCAMEVEIAELITEMIPSMERVRMVNSGTEATMSAIRLARGFTKREKIIKFKGCYHGHGDSFLISAGSGAMTMGIPDSPGVTQGTAKDTLLAPYNDLEFVEELVANNKGEIAAIIVEPVAGNMGCVLPEEGFLEGLRKACDQEGILLLFDEVMTGFRLARGGAQEVFNVAADITTLGKIIGGGLPVGAYGGRKEIMQCVAPSGPIYQAGTLSGNPLAMAAGHAQLSFLNENAHLYKKIEGTTLKIVAGYKKILKKNKLGFTLNQIGSMFSLFFTEKKVKNLDDAKECKPELFKEYFHYMLQSGVYLAPSQFESLFVSSQIGREEVQKIIHSFECFVNDYKTKLELASNETIS